MEKLKKFFENLFIDRLQVSYNRLKNWNYLWHFDHYQDIFGCQPMLVRQQAWRGELQILPLYRSKCPLLKEYSQSNLVRKPKQ